MSASAQPQQPKGHRDRRSVSRKASRAVDPLPKSEAGKKLAELFLRKGWDWLYSSAPDPEQSPQWETVSQFKLTPIELEQLHQDPDSLVGIRPDSQTRWLVIDIDHHSTYHPHNNPHWLPEIHSALESIGITRVLPCQSSFSGGLHLYLPLPELVSSFWLSVCIKLNLEAIGIKLIGGECELYPNPKRFVPKGKGFSLFAGIRLPMQPGSGFYPLDSDLNPFPWSLEEWLDAFEKSAQHQDFSQLEDSILHSQEVFKLRRTHQPKSLASWQSRIEQEKVQGWNGAGETNEKLKIFACEARVFMGMDSAEQIAEYVEETARNAPGFYEHSRHVRELKRRCRDISHWAVKYYWPNGTTPFRETKYHSKAQTPADFRYHRAKRNAAHQRIEQAVKQLVSECRLPQGVTARAQAIIKIAHVSQQTLYKPHNKSLWHPSEYHPSIPSEVAEPQAEQDITQPQPEIRDRGASQPLKVLWLQVISQLLIQVGFVITSTQISAATALALKGQRADQAVLGIETLSERGESEGGDTQVSRIENWQQLRLSLPERFQTKLRQVKVRDTTQKVVQLPLALSTPTVESRTEEHAKEGGDPPFLWPKVEFPGPSASQADVVGCASTASVNLGRIDSQIQEEFNQWFELAAQLQVVTDSEWQDGEFWVEAYDGWHTYAEMVSTFQYPVLQRMVSAGPREGDCYSLDDDGRADVRLY